MYFSMTLRAKVMSIDGCIHAVSEASFPLALNWDQHQFLTWSLTLRAWLNDSVDISLSVAAINGSTMAMIIVSL